MPAAGNFVTFSQCLAAYSSLDFTRSPLAGKGTWCLLPTATKHCDRAGVSVCVCGGGGGGGMESLQDCQLVHLLSVGIFKMDCLF